MDPNLSLHIPKAHIRKGAKGNEVVFYEIRSSRRVTPDSCSSNVDDGDGEGQFITDVTFKRYSDFVVLETKVRRRDVE